MTIGSAARVAAAAALASVLIVLPARATSEAAPTIENEDPAHHWKPPTVTIEPGGTVVFENASLTTAHGIHWISTPATPTCEPSVPVGTGPAQSATNWSGGCSFPAAGTYTFYCTVHGAAMGGTVTVAAPARRWANRPRQRPRRRRSHRRPRPPPRPPSLVRRPATRAAARPRPRRSRRCASRRRRHGAVLHGALTIPAGDAGGRLEVDLLAARSALAAGGVRVGRLERRALRAGPLRFSLAAGAPAQRALRRRGRLALGVVVHLSPPAGAGSVLSRRLTLRR